MAKSRILPQSPFFASAVLFQAAPLVSLVSSIAPVTYHSMTIQCIDTMAATDDLLKTCIDFQAEPGRQPAKCRRPRENAAESAGLSPATQQTTKIIPFTASSDTTNKAINFCAHKINIWDKYLDKSLANIVQKQGNYNVTTTQSHECRASGTSRCTLQQSTSTAIHAMSMCHLPNADGYQQSAILLKQIIQFHSYLTSHVSHLNLAWHQLPAAFPGCSSNHATETSHLMQL